MPLAEEIPHERGHQRGVPTTKSLFLPLLPRLSWKRLPIDTNLLLIITSTANDLSGGYQHRWPWTTLKFKIRGLVIFFRDFRLRRTFGQWTFAEIARFRPRQPAYEIKLILSRVSWTSARISCTHGFCLCVIQHCTEAEKWTSVTEVHYNGTFYSRLSLAFSRCY